MIFPWGQEQLSSVVHIPRDGRTYSCRAPAFQSGSAIEESGNQVIGRNFGRPGLPLCRLMFPDLLPTSHRTSTYVAIVPLHSSIFVRYAAFAIT